MLRRKVTECHSPVFSLPMKLRPLGLRMHHIPACGRTASVQRLMRDLPIWPPPLRSLMNRERAVLGAWGGPSCALE